MKKSGLMTAILALLIASAAAQSPQESRGGHGPFGLGVLLGEPTGVSAKLLMGSRNAADLGLAWAFGNELFAVHADYLFSFPGLVVVKGADVPPFVGLGAYLHAVGAPRDGGTDVAFGVRFPVGIAHLFTSAPIEVSLELVPCLVLVPGTDFNLQGGIAVRWYF